jgi:gliding motility-associated-like protein
MRNVKGHISILAQLKVVYLFFIFSFFYNKGYTQICGTPGLDGAVNVSRSINTYFPPLGDVILPQGGKTLTLAAVPPNDPYGNNFGTEPIKAGDLLLIIQMQDAIINSSNSSSYGANHATSGPDNLGGTGFTNLGNTGRFEYLIATNAVQLTGGVLTFKGSGAGGGTVFTYVNAAPTANEGQKTFEIVRVPQYSNLVLTSNISTPPFNGKAGGIIAFDVAGSMDFAGFTIDASSKGFRGGYGIIAPSDANINNLYVVGSTDTRSVGKGESIAGTPRFMWDGYNQVDNNVEGLPGGSYGRGAPANGGGGGCDHNAGGGGGGNGGAGGVGGDGASCCGSGPGAFPNGGRPGSSVHLDINPYLDRLFLGGGGGGGDANDALTGVKGGVGGGIILLNVGSIVGSGIIRANGGNGDIGQSGANPDGAGGGGAGGTVFIKVSNPNPDAKLVVEAKGGRGGNTAGEAVNDEHGPGGGGGGGVILYSIEQVGVSVSVDKGLAGRAHSGAGIPHNAADGQDGQFRTFISTDLPPYLQGGGLSCFPQVNTSLKALQQSTRYYPGSLVQYEVVAVNTGTGNAGGVRMDIQLPSGFIFQSAIVRYTGSAGGPDSLVNVGTSNKPVVGDFNISPLDSVIVTISAKIDCAATIGKYNASAQTIYLDPTRTRNDNERRITGFINAFIGANISYETGGGNQVLGANYNGHLPTSVNDDITIYAAAKIENNVLSVADPITTFCASGQLTLINGTTPSGGSDVYSYVWQSSVNNIDFEVIPLADSKDFSPPAVSTTTSYRRLVYSLDCTPPIISNTVIITILPAVTNNTISLSDATALCSPGGNAANIVGSTPHGGDGTFKYQWQSSSDSTNFIDIAGAVNKDYNPGYITATTYYKRLAMAGLCTVPSVSDVVTVVVNPSPSLTSSLTPAAICSNSQFNYSPTSSLPGTAFTWSRGERPGISNAAASGFSDVSEALVNTGATTNKATYLYTLSVDGCTTVENVTVDVLPLPTLSSTTTPAAICTKSVFNYQPTSATPGANFAWIRGKVEGIGNGPANGIGNPNETLVNETQQPINVLYTYTISGGSCSNPNPVIVTVKVHPLPVADFIMPGFCLNDGVAKFINQSVSSADSSASMSYVWNFGDPNANAQRPNTSLEKEGAHAYTVIGEYTVSLTATTSNGCVHNATKVFTVNGSSPVADFTVKNAVGLCSNEVVELQDKATVDFGEITKIEWYYDYSNAADTKSTDENPALRSATARNYQHRYDVFHSPERKQINVRMVAYSGASCASEKIETIELKAAPEVVFTSLNAVCQHIAAFQFTQAKENHGLLTGTGIYSGNGVSSQGLFNPATAGVGEHLIVYSFAGNNGCKDEKAQQIIVHPSPILTASNTQVLEGGQVVLQAANSGAEASYKWTPATSLNRDNILTPIAIPMQDIVYTITATSDKKCETKTTLQVTVIKNPIVPNAFSPNGDGINDVWNIPYLNTFPNVLVQVFDRFGRQLYQSVGYSKPWDGRVGGKDLPIGTYYYIINPEGGRKPIQGSVTILR